MLKFEKGWDFVPHVYLTTPSHVRERPLLMSRKGSSGLHGVPVYVCSNTFLSEGPPPHHRNSVSIASSVPICCFFRIFVAPGHTHETPAIASEDDLRNPLRQVVTV